LHLKSVGVYFQTEDIKKPLQQAEALLLQFGQTCSDMNVYVLHFRLFIKIETKLGVAAIIFHPASCVIKFFNLLFTLFTFIDSSEAKNIN
jgi:hypothetical protein